MRNPVYEPFLHRSQKKMLKHNVEIRIFDTDMLGHCHHLAPAMWFEEARNDIFEIFNPEMAREKWNLILVRIELDYIGQIQFTERSLEIRTWVSHLGKSSLHVSHGAYLKDGTCVALGGVAMVCYDFQNQKSVQIPDSVRERLLPHFDEKCPYKLSVKRG